MDDWWTTGQLHCAAMDGDIARAEKLIATGYNLNRFDEIDHTPLHYAVKHEHFEMVSLLLRHGADVNAHNEPRIGNTPITEVAATCSLKLAKMLLDAGADPTIRGWMRLNALDIAKNRKRGDGPKVYELLRKHAPKDA